MCGIAGIIRYSRGAIARDITIMRDTFPWRGPDDRGSWVHPEGIIALGHRRLSILDPTPAGHQPMHSSEHGLTIVFNGEVYNYLEIRKELEKKGYCFTTGTDTEVILKSFAEWGENSLSRFNGMFALAIWDEHSRRLFLARDRLGIKPLYYFADSQGIYFASEVKAILRVVQGRLPVREDLIDAYMGFGYVPGEETMLDGVKRLLPGHCMHIKPEPGASIRPDQYWQLDFTCRQDRGEAYYLEKGRVLLDSAIDLRLRSDVPLGIFLSGGLDSSSVVGLLAPRVSEPLKTFSVAYDFGRQYDETPYARMVAEKFQTDHHQIMLTPEQFRDFIPRFIELMDEPVAESAAISLYFVSKLAREHVTVVLSGEGSDEIFAGYDLYRYMAVLERYFTLGGSGLTSLLARLGKTLLPEGSKLVKYLQLGSLPLEKRYKGISTYEERYRQRLYTPEFARRCRENQHTGLVHFLNGLFGQTANLDVLSRMLYFDTRTWLVDDLLIKADRMSMAASLELRVPFLDYRLVEFAASMPSGYKIRGGKGKYLLKQMMRDILPPEIIHRKKMGFPTPLKIMFAGELYDYACDILLTHHSGLTKYFSQKAIAEILREHKEQQQDHHRIIWQLIVLALWIQQANQRVQQ